jgi:predicted dehydrogenase
VVWSPDEQATRAFAAEFAIPRIVDRPQAMVGEVDLALILYDEDAGASHTELARPFLERGTPTFIDRPLTPDLRESVELLAFAQRHDAPLMTGSALRYAGEVEDLLTDLQGLGRTSAVTVTGPGHWWFYGLHSLELAQTVISGGMNSVRRYPFDTRDVAVLSTASGPTVIVTLLRDVPDRFHVTVHGTDGITATAVTDHWLENRDAGPHTFRTRMMAAAAEMARTRTPPLPPGDAIEVLALLVAGVRSVEHGTAVTVADVLEDAGIARLARAISMAG